MRFLLTIRTYVRTSTRIVVRKSNRYDAISSRNFISILFPFKLRGWQIVEGTCVRYDAYLVTLYISIHENSRYDICIIVYQWSIHAACTRLLNVDSSKFLCPRAALYTAVSSIVDIQQYWQQCSSALDRRARRPTVN